MQYLTSKELRRIVLAFVWGLMTGLFIQSYVTEQGKVVLFAAGMGGLLSILFLLGVTVIVSQVKAFRRRPKIVKP